MSGSREQRPICENHDRHCYCNMTGMSHLKPIRSLCAGSGKKIFLTCLGCILSAIFVSGFVPIEQNVLHAEQIDVSREFSGSSFNQSLNAPGLKVQLINALNYLANIQLSQSTPLHQQFFDQSLNGLGYLAYLKKVRQFIYIPTNSSGLIAYARAKNSSILITSNFHYVQGSLLEVAATLLHEAKHLPENGGTPHVICPDLSVSGDVLKGHSTGQPLVGLKACDNVVDGSYGVSIVMLDNVARYCTNCSDADRAKARELADQYLQRIIDKESFHRLVLDQKQVVYLDTELDL